MARGQKTATRRTSAPTPLSILCVHSASRGPGVMMGAHCTHTSCVCSRVCVSRGLAPVTCSVSASVGAGVEVLYITLKRAHYSLFFKVHTRLSRRARLPGQPPGAPPRARAAARRVRPPRARAKPKPLRGSRARAHMHGGARARCARETVTQVPSHSLSHSSSPGSKVGLIRTV